MLSSRLVNKNKPTILILLLLPSFIWVGMFINGNLGVNPIDILMDKLGEMSLRLLILVLIISSLSEFVFFTFINKSKTFNWFDSFLLFIFTFDLLCFS